MEELDWMDEEGASVAEVSGADQLPLLDERATRVDDRAIEPAGGPVGEPAAPEPLDPALEERVPEEELEVTFGTFLLGDSEFAMRAQAVREVVPYPDEVTPTPLCADSVHGVFSLRGEILPIVDAAALLGLPSGEPGEERRIAVVSTGETNYGLVFDGTGEVLRLAPEQVLPFECEDEQGKSVLGGVIRLNGGGRLVQVLDTRLLRAIPGLPRTAGTAESRRSVDPRTYAKAIVARVGDEDLAFRIEDVVEIQERLHLSSKHAHFDHCRGLVTLRDQVRALVDLRGVLGLEPSQSQPQVLFVSQGDAIMGLEVDALIETCEYPQEDLLGMPGIGQTELGRYARGVIAMTGARQRMLIDVGALLDGLGARDFVTTLRRDEVKVEEAAGDFGEEPGFILFRIQDSTMSFPLDQVNEVCEYPEDVIAIDREDSAVFGIMNLRGTLVPLVDPTRTLTSSEDDSGEGRAVIIADCGDELRGLVVDSVDRILRGRISESPGGALMKKEPGVDDRFLAQQAVLLEAVDGSTEVLVVVDPVRFLAA